MSADPCRVTADLRAHERRHDQLQACDEAHTPYERHCARQRAIGRKYSVRTGCTAASDMLIDALTEGRADRDACALVHDALTTDAEPDAAKIGALIINAMRTYGARCITDTDIGREFAAMEDSL